MIVTDTLLRIADDAMTRDARSVKAFRVHPNTAAKFQREQIGGAVFYGSLFLNGVTLLDDVTVPEGTAMADYDPPTAALASRWSAGQ